MVDARDEEQIKAAVQPNTKLIYLESPNSLTFEIQDITAVTKWAKKLGLTTIIDNSYNSPLNQNPISMGVDLVVHSATKYLNGHSDVVAGVVAGSAERIGKMMAEEYMTLGAIINAHDAYMIIRGLRTLELRVNRSASSAQRVAEFLEQHPKVSKVYYPMLKTNPQFELAQRQMKQGGGLLSVELNASGIEEVEAFCDSLKYFVLATSWGGHESRLYIGLEDPELLLEDLKASLDCVR